MGMGRLPKLTEHSANMPRKRSRTFTAQADLGGNKLLGAVRAAVVGLECRKGATARLTPLGLDASSHDGCFPPVR